MPTATQNPRLPDGRLPDRLPRAAAPSNRPRELRVGLLGVLGLLALIVGIPALLVLFVGYPLPTTAPSRGWLTVALSATLVIKVLAAVIWVVWAHFVVCVLSEWRALRRGRLPAAIPLGGSSQLVARRLVATVLLLAGTAAIIPHGGSGSAPPPRPSAPVAAAQVTPAELDAELADPHHAIGVATAGATAAAKTTLTKFYVVEPPEGRRYDSLWDIAQRTMGDPLRYREIFTLNQTRPQADGRSLTDANLIRPGWQLILPGDATGPGVQEMLPPATAPAAPAGGGDRWSAGTAGVPTAGVPTAGVPTAGAASAGAVSAGAASAATSATTPAAAAAAVPADPPTGPGGTSAPSPTSLALGGGLILAGLALALTARRGPYGEPLAEEVALVEGANPDLAARLDLALRDLCAARTAQQRPMPQPLLAFVSPEQVVLHLAGGDVEAPPAGWALDGAARRTWTRRLDATDPTGPTDPGVPAAAGPAPYPGFVAIGRIDGYDVFLDIEQAPGIVSIGGDLEQARDVVAAMAVGAGTAVWSDGARLTMVGFADAVPWTQLDTARVRQTDRLDELLDELGAQQMHAADVARRLGLDNVLLGRQLHPTGPWSPHIVVLSAPPSDEEAARLNALVGAGRSSMVVLCVGDLTSARWRFTVDLQGRLSLGVIGLDLIAHRLPPGEVARVLGALRDAEARAAVATAAVHSSGPRAAVELFGSRSASPLFPPVASGSPTALPVPGPAPRPPGAGAAEPRVLVRVLGPVTVQGAGELDPARRDLATEVVVAAALAPAGLHDAVLQASVWPRGVTAEIAAAALAGVVVWLGADASGTPRLRRDPDGRWRLTADVVLDFDVFSTLADEAAGAGELETLLRAVDLIVGPAGSGTPSGRYGWLAFAQAVRDARALGTVVVRRAASLLTAAGRRDEAVEVLRRGLTLVPTAEPIWRDLLTLLAPVDPAALALGVGQMYAVLRAERVRIAPETDALVEQLLPDFEPSPHRHSA